MTIADVGEQDQRGEVDPDRRRRRRVRARLGATRPGRPARSRCAAAAVSATVIGGETTSAAPPTISGKAKKNGLATPPVRATSRVATVIATEPSTTNLAGPRASAGSRSWTTSDEQPGEREQDAGSPAAVSGHSPVRGDDRGRGQQEDPGDDPDDPVVGLGRHAVVGAVRVDARRRPRPRRARRSSATVAPVRGVRARPAEQRRARAMHAIRTQVRGDGDHDQDQDRLDRHDRPRWFGARRPWRARVDGHLSRPSTMVRSAAGVRCRPQRVRDRVADRSARPSARPVLVGLLDQPQVDERLGLADARRSRAAARPGTRSSASLSSHTVSIRRSYVPAVMTT